MAHCLIAGRCESGKSTLARRLAREYAERGIQSLALDPIGDPKWKEVSAFCTSDSSQFMEVAGASRSCALFVDESGEVIGRYNSEMFALATRFRHYGHRVHFLTQRPAQLSPTVRDQCSTMYLFACSMKDAKILSDEWGRQEIADAHKLNQGEFFFLPRFGDCARGRIF